MVKIDKDLECDIAKTYATAPRNAKDRKAVENCIVLLIQSIDQET